MKEFYSRLFLKETASEEEVKNAYRKLVKVFHPDANSGATEYVEEFRLVQEAFDKIVEHLKSNPAISIDASITYREEAFKAGSLVFKTHVYDVCPPSLKVGFGLIYHFEGIKFVKAFQNKVYKVEADGIFLVVKLKVENIGLSTDKLKASYFKVDSMDKKTFDLSEKGMDGLALIVLVEYEKVFQPNIPAVFYLVFEVPKEGDYYLSLWGALNPKVKVCLNNQKQLAELFN